MAAFNEEPLLSGADDRVTLFPINPKYKAIFELYQQHVAAFWQPAEVGSFDADIYDFKKKLTDVERQQVVHILSFFASSDSAVLENALEIFSKDVKCPESKAFLSFQSGMEGIHQWMYSITLEALVTDELERRKAFDAVSNLAAVKAKYQWIKKWMLRDEASFAERLVAFVCVEGILFSFSFASIYYYKARGLLPAVSASNEWISRDEALHTRHGILLYAILMNKLSAATVAQIIKEAVQVELAFVEESLPEGLTGLTRVDMREYVKYIANSIYSALGCEPGQELFSGARNRLTFTNRIELDVKKIQILRSCICR